MKKVFFLWCMLCALAVQAQDMKAVFINMPDSLSPLLTKVNREDFVDFLASNMKAQVKNKFDRISELKAITDDYLLLETAPGCTTEIKLLPVNDSVKVICMIQTVCGEACDSRIRFFASDWKECSTENFLTLPAPDFFFEAPDSTQSENYRAARVKADMDLMKASLSPQNFMLDFKYTTPDYLDDESAKELEPFLKKTPVVYEWRSGKFVLKNP